ncbi:MAG: hypothetical protein QOH47_996 [Sphingomonadales bacterium]|jgi:tetratricopeptide (TPR) repeat protein|nr:hypothetical protein [Sphingomonadales bacterium]
MAATPPIVDHWKIFFSSCFTDAGDIYLSVRRRVRKTFNASDDKQVWMGEDFPILDRGSKAAPVEKALFCVKGVRHCEAYVAVIIDKHGTGIEIGPGKKTQASFLELELFEAAVSRRPAFIYILKGHEPTGRMAALLNLLGPALPGLVREPLDEDEILRRIERILNDIRHPWVSRLRRFAAIGTTAHDRLGISRHRPYQPATGLPALQFLGDPFDPTLAPPALDLVDDLLKRADALDDHQSRLAVIWMALRELMGARPDGASDDHLLHCWDSALAKWASTSAWYGLHGFCLMGCLGAISSRSRIIQNYRSPPPPPHGAFASEYYSIAKKVGDSALRAAFFDLALNHLDVTLRAQPDSQALAIRGSVYWQLGRRAEAVDDYERVVQLCEQSSAAPATLGSAKAELGFALVRSRGTRRRGLSLLQDGVDLGSSGKPDGFLVRAKRKLGYGYFLAGAPRRAMAELVDAYDMAADHGLFDQISKIERAAKNVDRLMPFLKHP